MTTRQVDALWLSITRIEAQGQLVANSSGDWPMMDKDSRGKMHKELFTLAYPDSQTEKNYVSAEDVQRMLGNGQ